MLPFNPMFSLLESLTHQEDFASQYRYMSEEEANKLFAQMVSSSDQNTYPLLNEEARKNRKARYTYYYYGKLCQRHHAFRRKA